MNLFVVRELNDAFKTVSLLNKIGLNAISFPITKCLLKKIPNYKQKYDFVLITSSKSIKIFLQYFDLYRKTHSKLPKIFVIGQETGNELRSKNFTNFYQAKGNSKDIVKLTLSETSNYQKGIWLCGFHRNKSLKKIFLMNKRFVKHNVVYEMRPNEIISESNLVKFKKSVKNSFIVNSSRNILLLNQILSKYDILEKVIMNSKIFCMSDLIKKDAFYLGWKDVVVINKSNRMKFLKQVKTYFTSYSI